MRLQSSTPLLTSIASATHRKAIPASRQRLTLRVTRRMVPIMFSVMFVQASDAKLLRQLQPDDSQDFLEACEDAHRYAEPLPVDSTREITDQFFSLFGLIELPGWRSTRLVAA